MSWCRPLSFNLRFIDWSPLICRHFATGKPLQELITSVYPKIQKELATNGDKPINPKIMLNLLLYNILSQMCFGKRYFGTKPKYWVMWCVIDNWFTKEVTPTWWNTQPYVYDDQRVFPFFIYLWVNFYKKSFMGMSPIQGSLWPDGWAPGLAIRIEVSGSIPGEAYFTLLIFNHLKYL